MGRVNPRAVESPRAREAAAGPAVVLFGCFFFAAVAGGRWRRDRPAMGSRRLARARERAYGGGGALSSISAAIAGIPPSSALNEAPSSSADTPSFPRTILLMTAPQRMRASASASPYASLRHDNLGTVSKQKTRLLIRFDDRCGRRATVSFRCSMVRPSNVLQEIAGQRTRAGRQSGQFQIDL